MNRAEVVDTTHQIQRRFQRFATPREMPSAPSKHREPLTEGSIQSLNVARRDHAAIKMRPLREKPLPCAIDQAHQLRLLHLLHQHQILPYNQAGSPSLVRSERRAKGVLERRPIACKAIEYDQERTLKRRPAHHLGYRPSGLMTTLFRDEYAEPQRRCHRDRREDIAPTPPTALKRMTALAACEEFVYLDTPECLQCKYDGFMDALGMMSRLSRPIAHGAALKAKSGFDSGYRASVRDERKDEHDHVGVGLEAHKGSAGSMAKGIGYKLSF